jgi:hypothetical protein
LLTRIAKPDQLGIRISGRPMVRPHHVLQHSRNPCSLDIGAVVDAWWNSGWWEGIVVQCGNDVHFQVYFPGNYNQVTTSKSVKVLLHILENIILINLVWFLRMLIIN